jgi:hypothetical protein
MDFKRNTGLNTLHLLDPSTLPTAYLHVENTVRYQPDTPEGAVEFGKLVPSGSHLVHIQSDGDESPQPYTVALLHQMRCMDIIRDEYNSRAARLDNLLLRHCMNYLRQSILCLADTRLEEVRLPLPGEVYVQLVLSLALLKFMRRCRPHTIFSGDYVCKDWNSVFAEAERSI